VKPLVLVILLLSVACARLPFTAEPPIRALVLNMHGVDVNATATLITNSGADLVLMQDVDSAALNALGTKLNYSAAGGTAGIAALARGFIGFNATIPLAPPPRAALALVASLRKGQIAAIDTQIDPTDGRVGEADLARISNAVSSQNAAGTPFVVGGNFNAAPDHGFTYPSEAPTRRVDYLFLAGDLHCSAATVMDVRISEHRPLLVTLK
jgi:endonuclease/exonuclease/phosphatase family metal-dependent hydrolase